MRIHAFVAVSTLLLSGCPRDGDKKHDSDGELPAVRVEALDRGALDREVRGTATVESERAVEIVAEAGGRIGTLPVEEGDEVRAGQLLCSLHNPRALVALDRARLELEQVQAELASIARLDERGFVARRSREEVEFRRRRAELEVRRAEEDVRLLRVHAPFAGVISRRGIDVGEVVTPQQRLFSLVDHRNLRAVVAVPEAQVRGLYPGLAARVHAVASGLEVEAELLRLAPVVDARSGTQRVTLALPAEKGLVAGTLVSVAILVERREGVLLAPRKALDLDGARPSLYRIVERPVEGGTRSVAERITPETGLRGDERVEILAGLQQGDLVVVAGQSALRDGAEVRVVASPGVVREDSGPLEDSAAGTPTSTAVAVPDAAGPGGGEGPT